MPYIQQKLDRSLEPYDVLIWISENAPEEVAVCILYDKVEKTLISTVKHIGVHFDPYHYVLRIEW